MKVKTDDTTLPKTVVMISNSYGINIFVKKLEEIIKAVRKGESISSVWFISSTLNSDTHKYINYLKYISKKHSWIHVVNFFTEPSAKDIESGIDFTSGPISLNALKKVMNIGPPEIHLSGTGTFIQTHKKYLQQLGVEQSNVKCVFIGQGIFEFENDVNKPALASHTKKVSFRKSNKSVLWDTNKGSLLETAESIGLTPKFSCRSGNCGECKAEISQGKINYDRQPEAVPQAGEILLCCTRPASNSGNIVINL